MSKARVSIARRSSTQGDGVISLSIVDDASGLIITDVEMEYADFAECITGLGHSKAIMRMVPTEYSVNRYGKKKETESRFCKKAGLFDKERQRDVVIKDFESKKSDGWEIWDDGTSSQQNGERHRYVVCRYT